jgi:hypothetical protein
VQDLLFYMREQIRLRTDRYSNAIHHYGPPHEPRSLAVTPPSQFNQFIPATMPATMTPPMTPPMPSPMTQSQLQPTFNNNPSPSPQRIVTRDSDIESTASDLRFLENILSMFTQPAGSISIWNTTLAQPQRINLGNLSPVIVAPTAEQLESGTTVYIAGPQDRTGQCMICLEGFLDGTQIRQINHCQHKFHKNCIDIWFTRNVHCPNCRHDIREEEEHYSYEEDNTDDESTY